MTNKTVASISFLASGHINQDITITDPNISPAQLVAMLNAGEAFTTIHEGEGVVRASDYTDIGTVFQTEPELEYGRFQEEGDFEHEDLEPFDMTHMALAAALGEFINEPEMSVASIIRVLEHAGNNTTALEVEEVAEGWTGYHILKETELYASGLRSLLKMAYDAGRAKREIV